VAQQAELTLLQFQERFKDDEACREHLFRIRWPEGFRCPHCGRTGYYNHTGRHLYVCQECGYLGLKVRGVGGDRHAPEPRAAEGMAA
jgi:predicted RNA-binding Zn-ribbon protein involved in translation (DUF1610 family)